MMQLLPTFISRDIVKFGKALSELDYQTGLFFKPVQGGIYCEKQSYKLVDHLLGSGAYGAGQSSWGPAIYGLTLKSESGSLADKMQHYLHKNKIKGNVLIASGCNRGAEITRVENTNFTSNKKGLGSTFELSRGGLVKQTDNHAVVHRIGYSNLNL